jgi:hypothetical protein
MASSDEFKKQVNELFKHAIDQLEEVKEVIVRSTGRFEADLLRLRDERDKLLRRLGEQTYRLANEGKLPVPAFVKATVDRLNEIIDHLLAQQSRANGKAGKKKAGKKRTSKKSTKKNPSHPSAT